MKRSIWALSGIGLGGALGWVALRSVTWGDALEAVAALDWRVLLMALGAVLFAGLMDALRWKLLLRKNQSRPSDCFSLGTLVLASTT